MILSKKLISSAFIVLLGLVGCTDKAENTSTAANSNENIMNQDVVVDPTSELKVAAGLEDSPASSSVDAQEDVGFDFKAYEAETAAGTPQNQPNDERDFTTMLTETAEENLKQDNKSKD